MIFLKKLLLATVKFGPPIFTSVVLTKHGNTGYVLLCVCESPHRHQKNDIEKNENDNEKILSNVKNFPQKIGALPRIELGKLALVTRFGTTPPYYSGKSISPFQPFPPQGQKIF